MAAPRTKRRRAKANVIPSVEDFEGNRRDGKHSPKLPTRPRNNSKKGSLGTDETSPSKTRESPRKPKPGIKDAGNQSLHSFFSPSKERHVHTNGNDMADLGQDLESQDAIQDSSTCDEAEDTELSAGSALGKRSWTVSEGNGTTNPPPGGSQKFLKKRKVEEPLRLALETKSQSQSDPRPWSEKYGPAALEELAVHKRKVNDVRACIEDILNGRERKRLLVLKGPAGVGKTTTISLLSELMDFKLVEWRNPVAAENSSEGYVSISAQFEEFLGRAGKFGALDLVSTSPVDQRKLPIELEPQKDLSRQVLLVEEYPNTTARASTALSSFRSAIMSFLVSTFPPSSFFTSSLRSDKLPTSPTPLVLIISESLLTTSTSASDSMTAHRLLGPQILSHSGTTVIEYNPIAPTFLKKALELVIRKDSRQSGRRRMPGPQVIKKLSEVGDIRNAIGLLEFLCVRGDADVDWGGKITFGKAKRVLKSEPVTEMTKMEQASLELITQREASLGLFHAVGKVVYNKREEDFPQPELIVQPPEHLSEHFRLKRSIVDIDSLIDETGTDTQTFVAALHENYILSCTSTNPEDTLDSVIGCIDSLSDSALIVPPSHQSRGRFGNTSFQSMGGGEALRQDEIVFQIAVRGVLFALPNPVKRQAPPHGTGSDDRGGKGRGGDAFKMFYPTSLRLWRTAEEIGDLVDLWVEWGLTGETRSSSVRPQSGVESWSGRFASSSKTNAPSEESSAHESLPMVLVRSNRTEMLLERLPYMALIRRHNHNLKDNRELEKITAFNGVGSQSEELPDEGDDGDTEEARHRKRKAGRPVKEKSHGVLGIQTDDLEKLVLSDDDIEDD